MDPGSQKGPKKKKNLKKSYQNCMIFNFLPLRVVKLGD
jgi:hypothetical protein